MANTSLFFSHSYPPFTLLLAFPSFLSHPSVLPLHPPILSHSCHTPALLSFHTLFLPHTLLSLFHCSHSSWHTPPFLPHSSWHTPPLFWSHLSSPSFILLLSHPPILLSHPPVLLSHSTWQTPPVLFSHPPVLLSHSSWHIPPVLPHAPSSLDASYPCFNTLLLSYSSFHTFPITPLLPSYIYVPSLCTPPLSFHTPPSVLTYTFPLFAHRTPLLSFHTTPTVLTALLAQYRNEQ